MDVSYLTSSVTTFCSPYSWHDYTFCLPNYYIIVLLNYLTITNCIFLSVLFVYLTCKIYILLYSFLL